MNPSRTTPKDFFLHLGAAIALYSAAVAIINLFFNIINYLYPDALAGYFYAGSIAWPISMLVILVPILYTVEWLLGRDITKTPEKKEVWVRRWRIYLTLFLAVVLIGGDLIALINTYLSGEITARFAWKIVAVILVAATVGKYYLFSVYEKPARAVLVRKVTAWFGIILVLAAIVGGFLIVGSPGRQRDLRFDNQRVSDLTNVQWQIVSYWQQRGRLPVSLEALKDPISGFTVPADPETFMAYEYSAKWTPAMSSNPSFELCATFSQPSQDTKGKGAYGRGYDLGGDSISSIEPSYYPGIQNDSWIHQTGRTCFERTIDPNRYPVSPNPKGL